MNSPEIQRIVDALRLRSADLYDRTEKEAAENETHIEVPGLETTVSIAAQEYIAREFRWLADILEGKYPSPEQPRGRPNRQYKTDKSRQQEQETR